MTFYNVVKLEDYNDRDRFIYLFSDRENALITRAKMMITLANYSGDISTYIDECNGNDDVYIVSSYSDLNAEFFPLENEDGLQVMVVRQDYGDDAAYIIHEMDEDDDVWKCDLSSLE